MGSQDSKIQVLQQNVNKIQGSLSAEVSLKYSAPFRQFSQLYQKGDNEFQSLVSIIEPYQQKFNVIQIKYENLQNAFISKTQYIQIDNVFTDEKYIDRYIYQIKDLQNSKTILIRPFKNYNSHIFENYLCQIKINQEIKNLKCIYLHKIIDYYIIETSLQNLQYPNSEIIIMQGISTTLSQIIQYRRLQNWQWTVGEFNKLFHNLIQALYNLHINDISHNDIRPNKIYYSNDYNCYLLGDYSNCIKKQGNYKSNIMRVSTHFNAPEINYSAQFDLKMADVYSLGMTLLCAFYLCQPIQRKNTVDFNKDYEGKYQAMKLIQSMIAPLGKRSNISEIRDKLPKISNPQQNMSNIIESLKYKRRPKGKRQIKHRRILADAYLRIGLWNEWKDELIQAYQLEQISLDTLSKADYLKEIAFVQKCRGSYDSSNHYGKMSSQLYRKLAQQVMKQQRFSQTEIYLKKATQCSKYFEFQNDIQLAKTLQAMAQLHCNKNQYSMSKNLIKQACLMTIKSQGKDSYQYCRIKIHEAKIENEFGQFDKAQIILQECKILCRKKQQINQYLGLKLKAKIHQEMSKLFLKKAIYDENIDSKQLHLSRSQIQAIQSIKINENFDENNHITIANNIEVIGQIYFKKKQYMQAKKYFQKSLTMRTHYMQILKDNNQYLKQNADTLCHISCCQTFLGQHQVALITYQQALKNYRKIYGSDYNKYSALAIANMSKVYINMGERDFAKQSIKCAMNILKDTVGEQDPDYQHFQTVVDKINNN